MRYLNVKNKMPRSAADTDRHLETMVTFLAENGTTVHEHARRLYLTSANLLLLSAHLVETSALIGSPQKWADGVKRDSHGQAVSAWKGDPEDGAKLIRALRESFDERLKQEMATNGISGEMRTDYFATLGQEVCAAAGRRRDLDPYGSSGAAGHAAPGAAAVAASTAENGATARPGRRPRGPDATADAPSTEPAAKALRLGAAGPPANGVAASSTATLRLGAKRAQSAATAPPPGEEASGRLRLGAAGATPKKTASARAETAAMDAGGSAAGSARKSRRSQRATSSKGRSAEEREAEIEELKKALREAGRKKRAADSAWKATRSAEDTDDAESDDEPMMEGEGEESSEEEDVDDEEDSVGNKKNIEESENKVGLIAAWGPQHVKGAVKTVEEWSKALKKGKKRVVTWAAVTRWLETVPAEVKNSLPGFSVAVDKTTESDRLGKTAAKTIVEALDRDMKEMQSVMAAHTDMFEDNQADDAKGQLGEHPTPDGEAVTAGGDAEATAVPSATGNAEGAPAPAGDGPRDGTNDTVTGKGDVDVEGCGS